MCVERHYLEALGPVEAIVLVFERYLRRIGGNQAAVRNRYAVGVAGQVGTASGPPNFPC